MWVNGNIPNGIVNWNATVTLSNSNVPVIGVQYGWYYLAGNALELTSIPSQIVGTAGTISTSAPAGSNTNTFTFGITNNSGTSQIVYYGYTQLYRKIDIKEYIDHESYSTIREFYPRRKKGIY